MSAILHRPLLPRLPNTCHLHCNQLSAGWPLQTKKKDRRKSFSSLASSGLQAPRGLYRVVNRSKFQIHCAGDDRQISAQSVSCDIDKALQILEKPLDSIVSNVDQKTALKTVLFWIGAAATFGIAVGFREGTGKASEFFAGYLLEQSLSVDNLFVFVLIFDYFKVPFESQGRVLNYGVAGAVIFRAVMIAVGIASLERFNGLNLFFAAILLFSSFKLVTGDDEDEEDDLSNNFIINGCKRFIPVTPDYEGKKFFVQESGILRATPLFLTLVVIELSDVAFAVDSIPAVFGVTTDPLIVYTSNIFAILGLRSLYILISGSLADLKYLQPAVGTVLGFIGSKMIGEFFGFHLPTEASLGIVGGLLGLGIALSLIARDDNEKS